MSATKPAPNSGAQPVGYYWCESQCAEPGTRTFRVFALFDTGKCYDFAFANYNGGCMTAQNFDGVRPKIAKTVLNWRTTQMGPCRNWEFQNRAKNWILFDEINDAGYPEVLAAIKRLVDSGDVVWPHKRLGY